MKKLITIGSRGSELALWQARFLQSELADLGYNSKIKIIKTKGDRIDNLSFDKIEGKGFFTKEIEEELLDSKIDVAVHSMKDLPTTSDSNLIIAGVSQRASPTDSLIISKSAYDVKKRLSLKNHSIVGTSSARRKSQLLDLNHSVVLKDLRGNITTRLKKLEQGNYDAIVLASAGLERLHLDTSKFIVKLLHPREFVPAPAQGVLAYQTKKEDIEIRKIIFKISKKSVAVCTNVERKLLQMFDGGCQLPLGVYCHIDSSGIYKTYTALAVDSHVYRAYDSRSTNVGIAKKLYSDLQSMITE